MWRFADDAIDASSSTLLARQGRRTRQSVGDAIDASWTTHW
jgi:hypothetical protein